MGIFKAAGDAIGTGFGMVDRNTIEDPFGDVQSAEAQLQAQEDALAQQERLAKEAQEFFKQQSDKGIGYTAAGADRGAAAIGAGEYEAQNYLTEGLDRSIEIDNLGRQESLGALGEGYEQGRSDLAKGYSQGRTDLGVVQGLQRHGAGATTAINTADAYGQSMLAQPGGLYGGFEQDPGYQFRQQQGEEAINRSAAAKGGRLGGATLKALSEYNQGLASQEYENFAARQQAAAGLQSGLLQNQAGRQDAAALAAQNNQMGLAGMGYGAQSSLADMAAQSGALNAGMATQYGAAQSDVYGRSAQNLSDLVSSTASQQAGYAMGAGSQKGDIFTNAGANMGNIAIGVGGNAQQNANNLMGAYQNFAQSGGMVEQAKANSNRETAGMIASFFSDRRLKTDIEQVPSKYERIGLRGYKWRWNDTAEGFGLYGGGEGVMAQETAEIYPAAVGELRDGYLGVDYAMLDRLVEQAH